MSSPELSNDEYDYENYSIESYQDEDGAPLISKRARLLAAATQNDIETFKQLLDSPKWYKVRDKCGLNLLQIAILTESDEVFDYLLSLDDFPLEAIDDEGCTALVVALSYFMCSEESMGDRYAFELIKKGADIDKISREGDPLLHCALKRGFVRVARLLLERGADVNMLNSEGSTPLHMCFYCNYDFAETVTMLLCYGADPDLSILDHVLNFWYAKIDDIFVAQEILFNFTVDEWSSYNISGSTLLQLAQKKSPLFHQVVKFASEIIFEDKLDLYCHHLFSIDSEYLRILLEKYPHFVKEVLQSYSGSGHLPLNVMVVDLEIYDTLIQSSLCSDVIEIISKQNVGNIMPIILGTGKNVQELIETIYYLLSYGMSLNEIDLENIYIYITGYTEDFKNLLFMDVEKQIGVQITETMPRLIYDVTLDMHKIVEDLSSCEFINWDQIFHYFIHPKIQDAYRRLKPNQAIRRQLPRIPLLQELARDVFRKYFLKTFKITTAKKFYTLIKSLPISSVHKKIITFESRLY